ncbi:AEC family transporter [Butyrivibrio sp. NC3005]|uniref:AEC family transporter n=1 Tax=Butyrivibrio sp. NC3005 TaxID=1280685 RepID=UPI000413E5AB|nr:AEC family transporter [Butyrivibrio sp. NC3005]
MDNLIFSLNATLPIFIIMMMGYFFKKLDIIDEQFAKKMNAFVFKIALPVNLFVQLCEVDFYSVWDTSFVIFCFCSTLGSVITGILISFIFCHKETRGEFVQASYRSSASLLGMTYIENIYGKATMGPLMMLGCVPLYNIVAVLILSLMNPNGLNLDKKRLKSSIIGIITNPIIYGILLGFVWALTDFKLPIAIHTSIDYLGRLASPMGLLSMGALLDFDALSKNLKDICGATFMKLILFTAIFLPIAIKLGFREEKLIAVLIMLGSAATVAGFVMAKNMGHKGVVSAGTVALSTVLSSFTLTFWIFILKSLSFV